MAGFCRRRRGFQYDLTNDERTNESDRLTWFTLTTATATYVKGTPHPNIDIINILKNIIIDILKIIFEITIDILEAIHHLLTLFGDHVFFFARLHIFFFTDDDGYQHAIRLLDNFIKPSHLPHSSLPKVMQTIDIPHPRHSGAHPQPLYPVDLLCTVVYCGTLVDTPSTSTIAVSASFARALEDWWDTAAAAAPNSSRACSEGCQRAVETTGKKRLVPKTSKLGIYAFTPFTSPSSHSHSSVTTSANTDFSDVV